MDEQLRFGEDELLKRQRAHLPLFNELVKLVDSKGSSKDKNVITDLVTKVTLLTRFFPVVSINQGIV